MPDQETRLSLVEREINKHGNKIAVLEVKQAAHEASFGNLESKVDATRRAVWMGFGVAALATVLAPIITHLLTIALSK